MTKAYRFKLEPNKQQRYTLARALDLCREFYKDALCRRKLHQISRYEQSAELTALKSAFPVYNNVYSQVLQQVLDKLDKSFKNFFRSGFGFPRFKGENKLIGILLPWTRSTPAKPVPHVVLNMRTIARPKPSSNALAVDIKTTQITTER